MKQFDRKNAIPHTEVSYYRKHSISCSRLTIVKKALRLLDLSLLLLQGGIFVTSDANIADK